MKSAVLLLAFLALPSLAFAQTYELKIYVAGASAPQQSYALGSVQCGQTPPPLTASNVNPTAVVWTDPASPTLVCRWAEAAGGPILSRPVGSYEGTLTATNEAGSSPESARAPFFVKASPAAPTGLRFSR